MIKEKMGLIKAIMNKEDFDKTEKLFNEYLSAFANEKAHSGEELMDYGRTYSMYIKYMDKKEKENKEVKN